jgi:hypothetical protein
MMQSLAAISTAYRVLGETGISNQGVAIALQRFFWEAY